MMMNNLGQLKGANNWIVAESQKVGVQNYKQLINTQVQGDREEGADMLCQACRAEV